MNYEKSAEVIVVNKVNEGLNVLQFQSVKYVMCIKMKELKELLKAILLRTLLREYARLAHNYIEMEETTNGKTIRRNLKYK